ncbi:MAG: YhbY family RNA-binding protein [Eubacteriales bacterium]
MLSSRQRDFLRKLANDIPDIIHVGKDGITPNLIVQLKDALKSRELVKGKVMQNCPEDIKTIAQDLSISSSSDIVSIIGSKFILYKHNHTNPMITLPKKKTKE